MLLPVAGLALVSGFLAYASCASSPDAPARAPEVATHATSSSTTPDSLSAPPPHTATDAGASPAKARGPAIAPTAANAAVLSPLPPQPVLQLAPAGSSGSTTAVSIPHVDSLALPLLADIERELKRDPPPEAHALVAELRRGAERATLIDFVRQRFPHDLSLRAIALRWIDRVRPAPSGTSEPSPPPLGSGDGPTWVAPIGKR